MRARSSVEFIEVDNNGIGWNVKIFFAGHRHAYDRFDRTAKTQLPPVITNYECRNCGCTNFETIHTTHSPSNSLIRKSEKIGPPTGPKLTIKRIENYSCPNCSVVFNDPTKFSKNQPPHITPPVATERPNRFELSEKDEEVRQGLQEAFQKIHLD